MPLCRRSTGMVFNGAISRGNIVSTRVSIIDVQKRLSNGVQIPSMLTWSMAKVLVCGCPGEVSGDRVQVPYFWGSFILKYLNETCRSSKPTTLSEACSTKGQILLSERQQ